MGRNSKISKKHKIKACKDYLAGLGSLDSIGKNLGVTKESVRRWVINYERHCDEAFEVSSKNKTYSRDFKLRVVNDFLNGYESSVDIAAKYNITYSMVSNWVNKYNDGIEIKDYNPRTEVYTMKKRQTTCEERLEVAKWVVSNDMNYKGASLMFSIPYASVYKWTNKYLKNGEEALAHNKRGRNTPSNKDLDSLSEVERLKYLLNIEKKKRERAELELKVLKKKEELEIKHLYRK